MLIACLACPMTLLAATTREAVKAKPGDIVLLRNVPPHPITRAAPPGLALMVDPKPNAQLLPALGATELSNREAAMVSAPIQRVMGTPHSALATQVRLMTAGNLGGASPPGSNATNTSALGAVGNTMQGLGGRITGALQALPIGRP